MGQIARPTNQKWVGYFHIYVQLEDGSEKRLRRKITLGERSAMSKGEAEDKLREYIRRARGQNFAFGPKSMVATLCDDYFHLRKGDWSEANQATVRCVLDNLIKPAIGHLEAANVTSEILKTMTNAFPERQWKTPKGELRLGISRSYIRKAITYTRAIFGIALTRGLIAKNPARDPEMRLTIPQNAPREIKNYLKPTDIRSLLAQLNAEDDLIVHLALLCATRPNEIFALRHDDVGDGWVRIDESLDRHRQSKDPKTQASNSMVSVPLLLQRKLADWMRQHPGNPSDLLFPNRAGRPRNRQNELNRMLKPAAKKAGLPPVTFQMLRRTFSTLAQSLGGLKDIQAQMRHSNPDTTAAVYMQPIPAQQEQTVRQLEEMLLGRAAGTIQ